MKINLLHITSKTSTNADGDIFYDFLKDNASDGKILVSIPGHLTMSSSFLNSSIGKFIDIFGIEKFKNNVKISSNKSIFEQLKKYVDFYTDLVE